MLRLFEEGDPVVVVESDEPDWIGEVGTIAESEPHHIYGWLVSGIGAGRMRFHSRQLRKA